MFEISGRHHDEKFGGKHIGIIRPLGDRFDYIAYCDTISKLENSKVYMNLPQMKDQSEILKLFNNKNLEFGSNNLAQKIKCTEGHMSEVYSKIDDWFKIPNIPSPKEFFENFPDNYITMQWDANQEYRRIDNDRKTKIINKYLEMGYKIVPIGGESKIKELNNGNIKTLISVIGNAKLHIGSDSGMPQLAKLVIPSKNIHLYVNTNKAVGETHARRFPHGISVSWLAFEIFKKGGKMNYVETYGDFE